MNDLHGTFACPICGVTVPHRHTDDETELHRLRAAFKATTEQRDALQSALSAAEAKIAELQAALRLSAVGSKIAQVRIAANQPKPDETQCERR